MGALVIAMVILIAFVTTVVLGIWIIPLLKKLNFGQTILEIGPRWHKDKQGTPTMGGFMFMVGIGVAVLTGFLFLTISIDKNLSTYTSQNNRLLFANMIMAVAFSLIGIIDDFIKVKQKDNQGLSEAQKLILQFILSAGYLLIVTRFVEQSTHIWIPFVGTVNFGLFYYPIMILGITFMVNSVNLTDGIDGLCSSVTCVVAIGFLVLANMLSFPTMQIQAAALIGGCVGFLVWNLYPAKVFMGDTGSLFLGGMVVGLAFGLKIPVVLFFMGLIYIIEGVTVMIQTTYFKYTRKKYGEGRRIFKMTPIHHHFEMMGWSENRIVIVFTLVQTLACALGIIVVKIAYLG